MDKDSNIVSPEDDGAGEQLVEEKNGQKSKGVEVKYMSPQNGDAKIDIENLKTAFAGMGKEELMKFANDPFWVKTRWFLFILFWLLWVAMLAGAIAIIVLAPRCAPPSPREWWEKSPLYKANVARFTMTAQHDGDLKGFTSKLDYLSSLGVKTIVLSNILKVSDEDSDGVDEFKDVAPAYGTLDDFKHLIYKAKQYGLQVLLTLVPNHSSIKSALFNQSLSPDSAYASYYVWAPSKSFSAEGGEPEAPNNWRSKEGGSAWEWNEARRAFYLHQFNKHEPEFNFHNPDVIKYFNDVMQFWLNLGVSGFYLERTPYLLEDPELRNDSVSRVASSATHLDYDFYSHSRTSNLPELQPLLANWKSLVANSSGILLLDEVNLASDRAVSNTVLRSQTLKPYPEFSVDELLDLINTTLVTNSWPVWQIRVENEEESSDLSKGLLLFSMLLPGIPVTLSGQELGLSISNGMPWSYRSDENKSVPSQEENKHSFLSAYKELVKARESPSVLHGTIEFNRFNGTSVITYTRLKSGSPGYLVVFNVGTEDTVVDVSQLDTVPEELSLLLTSDASPMADKTKIESKVVTLPGRAVAVFSFVPEDK